MLAFRDIPPPTPEITAGLLGLALLLWLWARVSIVRRHLARGGAIGDVPRTPVWLVRLSLWPPTPLLLLILALSSCGLLYLGLR